MELNATQYGDIKNNNQPAILILHGLFGSHRNWHPIAKKLSEKHRVYALDLRNHGQSPHTERMDYPLMAQDVIDFIALYSLSCVNIIAHSMGGKSALWLALKRPELIEKLIIVDIAPVSYSHEFDAVLQGFKSIPLLSNINSPAALFADKYVCKTTEDKFIGQVFSPVQSRKEADEILSKSIKQASLRQFLLQNLQYKKGRFQWRLNLEAISRSIPLITGFPDTAEIAPYSKRVLFIGGGQSDYLNKANQKLTRQLFPLASFSMIKSAGHWLHSEQPEIFMALIEPYLSGK
ncbi:MAG: alpha/beta fold hydrolase [gamma proteobacterium symbiont of Taylorina sp.]|nr:alpha/beta fold hydrolase [gamma proteobacterium symbiont of Taylorina sp.]